MQATGPIVRSNGEVGFGPRRQAMVKSGSTGGPAAGRPGRPRRRRIGRAAAKGRPNEGPNPASPRPDDLTRQFGRGHPIRSASPIEASLMQQFAGPRPPARPPSVTRIKTNSRPNRQAD